MTDWKTLQANLGVAADNKPGPITFAALFRKMGAPMTLATDLGRATAIHFPAYGIMGNGLRLAHFMAQAAHETAGFRYMAEVWGPTPAQARYDTRTDLGNTATIDGDGKLYRGHGIFQITGRRNHKIYGDRIGVDLVANPDQASEPDIAVKLACLFWDDVGLNAYADADDVLAVSRGINTSGPRSKVMPNGLDDRKVKLAKLKGLIG